MSSSPLSPLSPVDARVWCGVLGAGCERDGEEREQRPDHPRASVLRERRRADHLSLPRRSNTLNYVAQYSLEPVCELRKRAQGSMEFLSLIHI